MDKEKVLEELGFSRNEAKVYLALLELGSATATKISDKSKIHRTTVYDCLERLVKKGFASYIIKEDKKCFKATNPENLFGIIREKEELLKSIIPELRLSKRLAPEEVKASIYEGMSGIKAITEDILATLKEGEKVITFGNPKDTNIKLKSFVEIYHKRRIAKKITQIHIYNEDANERIAHLKKLPYTEAGFLPKKYDSPAATTVYDNKVAFFIWSEKPFAILIESEKMASAYRRYAELLWEMAEK